MKTRYRVMLIGDREKVLYDGYDLNEAKAAFEKAKANLK